MDVGGLAPNQFTSFNVSQIPGGWHPAPLALEVSYHKMTQTQFPRTFFMIDPAIEDYPENIITLAYLCYPKPKPGATLLEVLSVNL